MAGDAILAQFTVDLTEDILRDIITPGKLFATDIKSTDSQSPSRPTPGPGLDLRASTPIYCVHLDKISDSLIKLVVTVYKGSQVSLLVESSVQTTETEWKSFSSQTDLTALRDNDSQTLIKTYTTSPAQTVETRLHQSFSDATSETTFNLSTQVERHASARVEMRNSRTQASVDITDSHCQTHISVRQAEIQTERHEADSGMQTEELVLLDTLSQTDMSLALQTDRHTQVELSIVDTPMQTELEVYECESQTTTSMALQADCEVQASVSTASHICQTELYVGDAICQTDTSMARQADTSTQYDTETASTPSQTDTSMALQADTGTQYISETASTTSQTETDSATMHTQTDMSMALQCDQVTQSTVTECLSTESQTNVAVLLEQESQAVADTANMTSQAGSDNSHQTSQTDLETIHQLSQTDQDTQQSTQLGQRASTTDGMSQTDPVTIIIGDASFLVKKLKSSAVSPSKVTTTGNEIEIEVCADAPGIDVPTFELEEKENEEHRQPLPIIQPQQQAPVQRSGPMIRGGYAPRRGGVAGGAPRFRLPAVQPLQSAAVVRGPAVRLPTPVIQRRPAPIVAVTPRPAGPQPVLRPAGPQPVMGGSFSCPFCSLTFIDSPALYEHLSINHQVDQKTKWKQPRGREGKTIIPKQQKSPERDPPILTPIEPYSRGAPRRRDAQQEHETTEEPGLFEDPVEPKEKKKRGRASKAKDEDLETSYASEDNDGETSNKRKRAEDGDYVARGRAKKPKVQYVEVDEEEEVEPAEEQDDLALEVTSEPTRRSQAKTPRGRRK